MNLKLTNLKNEINELTPKLFELYNDQLKLNKEALRAQIDFAKADAEFDAIVDAQNRLNNHNRETRVMEFKRLELQNEFNQLVVDALSAKREDK